MSVSLNVTREIYWIKKQVWNPLASRENEERSRIREPSAEKTRKTTLRKALVQYRSPRGYPSRTPLTPQPFVLAATTEIVRGMRCIIRFNGAMVLNNFGGCFLYSFGLVFGRYHIWPRCGFFLPHLNLLVSSGLWTLQRNYWRKEERRPRYLLHFDFISRFNNHSVGEKLFLNPNEMVASLRQGVSHFRVDMSIIWDF